ncbi:Dual specificity protein phosphatase DSP8 [Balamuthia mandrillaris]
MEPASNASAAEQKKQQQIIKRDYRLEPVAWMPFWMAVVLGRFLFFPTLFYNIVLYWLMPWKFCSWWNRIDDTVLLGALPLYWYVPALFREGVRGVVNTCDEYAGPWRSYQQHKVEQIRIPIVDYFPPTLSDVKKGVAFIRKFQERGESVYVHCKAGRGRSTTIVLCYLIQRYKMDAKEAQEFIAERRPQVSTIYKRKVVYDWIDYLRSKETSRD